jgi:hypothetical protein
MVVSARGMSLEHATGSVSLGSAASKRVCSALGRVKTVLESAGDELLEGTRFKHLPSSLSGFNNEHGPKEKLGMSVAWLQCHCG